MLLVLTKEQAAICRARGCPFIKPSDEGPICIRGKLPAAFRVCRKKSVAHLIKEGK